MQVRGVDCGGLRWKVTENPRVGVEQPSDGAVVKIKDKKGREE
jgi:hypothetical protein